MNRLIVYSSPNANFAIIRTARNGFPIVTYSDARYAVVVEDKFSLNRRARNVPNENLFVIRSGNEDVVVRGKGERANKFSVTFKFLLY